MPTHRPAQRGETGFALLLLVFSVTAFWQAYAISGFSGLSTPGVFPMLASATMVVAAVFILVQSIQRKPGSDLPSEAEQGFLQTVLPARLLVMMALITAYVIAMPAFGFLVASGVFLFVSFHYLWRKSLLISTCITLAALVSVYLVFRKLFQVVLPKGTLFQGWF